MSPIRVLSSEVVAKIAAGEVVERPASVVKELVDNALDAGATQVTVEAQGGGVRLIRVTDNGQGIPAAEVEAAFARHATSKLSKLSDLEAITTLGFRGEALPSIAAVAEVNMVTHSHDEAAGTFLNLKNGAIIEKLKRGCPQGTTVTVRNLFRSIPARLKFLKSPATENSHITNLVSQYALAFPEVKFTLVIEGRTILRSPGSGDLREALAEVYGAEIAQAMLEVKGEDASIAVSGLVSPPQVARSSRGYLSFFVNRRWVQSRMLAYAVEEAYQGLLMTGRHPIAALNIALPPQEVDVNVHPAKSEVRFLNERAVFGVVQRAVRATLVGASPVPELRPRPIPTPSTLPMPIGDRPASVPSRQTSATPLSPQTRMARALPILRILGQVANTYIIAEGPDGMYLIDQHTAHERVLYEGIRAEQRQQAVEVQGLLQPLSVELTARQEGALRRRGEALARSGFSIEPFGEQTYLIRAVPALLKGQAREVLLEVLDAEGEAAEGWEERIAVSMACHGAVKAGQALSPQEMEELVRQLEATSLPNNCPHGRPTLIHLSSAQLEKEFGRS